MSGRPSGENRQPPAGAPAGWAAVSVPEAVAREIRAAGGAVTFAEFMGLALTHPTAGYYTGSRSPLGATGDFVTVPQRAPFFNRVLGRLLAELLRAVAQPPALGGAARLVEVGPGEGDMAAGVLAFFEQEAPELKDILCYQLVEPGPHLRQLQRRALADAVARGWRVEWPGEGARCERPTGGGAVRRLLTPIPAGGPGVVVTNELLDALPVHLIDVRGAEPLEAWVQLQAEGAEQEGAALAVVWKEPCAEAAAELDFVLEEAGRPDPRSLSRDGFIELRPAAGRFLEEAARALGSGVVVTVDYGAWRGVGGGAPAIAGATAPPPAGPPAQLHELTVRGYFRHQRQGDPLQRAGGQDLTADVDFAALAAHGRRLGFETMLFLDLATLLAAGDAAGEAARLRAGGLSEDALQADAAASLLQALLDPADSGGLFKVMVQVKE